MMLWWGVSEELTRTQRGTGTRDWVLRSEHRGAGEGEEMETFLEVKQWASLEARGRAGAQGASSVKLNVMSWARGVCQRPQWAEHWLAFFELHPEDDQSLTAFPRRNWDSFQGQYCSRSLISVIPDPETLRAHTNRIFSVWGPRESQVS